MPGTFAWFSRGLSGAAITCFGFAAFAGAPPAGAAPIVTDCSAFNINPDGSTGDAVDGAGSQLPIDLGDFTGGVTEVQAGGTYPLGGTPSPFPLPPNVELDLDDNPATPPTVLAIQEIKNITIEITFTGAAAVSTPTVVDGNVIDPTATIVGGNVLRLVFPGSQVTSAFPVTGNPFFPGGSTFQPPSVSFTVTAGAAGTTISGSLTAFQVDARIANLNFRQVCTPQANSLGSVQVVAAPQPGAPNAVSDTAVTKVDTAVMIDVLANDTPNPTVGIDPASLKIVVAPTSGSAVVDGGVVAYTPNPGFSGTDRFDYELCSLADATGVPGTCDPATVTVTVENPAAATTTTTAAPPPTVAATQLPVTGSGTGALTLAGLAFVTFGTLTSVFARSVTAHKP